MGSLFSVTYAGISLIAEVVVLIKTDLRYFITIMNKFLVNFEFYDFNDDILQHFVVYHCKNETIFITSVKSFKP